MPGFPHDQSALYCFRVFTKVLSLGWGLLTLTSLPEKWSSYFTFQKMLWKGICNSWKISVLVQVWLSDKLYIPKLDCAFWFHQPNEAFAHSAFLCWGSLKAAQKPLCHLICNQVLLCLAGFQGASDLESNRNVLPGDLIHIKI